MTDKPDPLAGTANDYDVGESDKTPAQEALDKAIEQIKHLNQHCLDGGDVSFITDDGSKIEWNLGEAYSESIFFDNIQEAIHILETQILKALQAESVDVGAIVDDCFENAGNLSVLGIIEHLASQGYITTPTNQGD